MRPINKLTISDKDNLLSKTFFVLPDNPSTKNFSASQIKKKGYEGFLVLFDFINDLIDEINANSELSNQEVLDINNLIETIQSYFSSGKAKKAIADEDGNNIKDTYLRNFDAVGLRNDLDTLIQRLRQGQEVVARARCDGSGREIEEVYLPSEEKNIPSPNQTIVSFCNLIYPRTKFFYDGWLCIAKRVSSSQYLLSAIAIESSYLPTSVLSCMCTSEKTFNEVFNASLYREILLKETDKTTNITATGADRNCLPTSQAVFNAIQIVLEIAEGRTQSFTVDTSDVSIDETNYTNYFKADGTQFGSFQQFSEYTNGLTCGNALFGVQDQEISLNGRYVVDNKNKIIKCSDLKEGTIINVTNLLVPDRWISIKANSQIVAYQYETKNKQDVLVSGTNIKTVNGQSILGAGDIDLFEEASDADIEDIMEDDDDED